MSEEIYPATLQPLIDRAGNLTAEEIDALGKLWESGEDLVLPTPNIAGELLFGTLEAPIVTNEALLEAWQHALDAAGDAGRATELDAARAAGRALHKDDRHAHDSESSKNGAEDAVRSAVLAVAVRDLISDEDYQVLVAPWQKVLGTI